MKIILQPKRDESLRRRHPWLFSGAIQKIEGQPSSGDTVEIYSAKGEWLARGAWSPHSQISVRIWTYNPEEQIDAGFFQQRLKRAIEWRSLMPGLTATAVRLVNSESDELPGLIIDRYVDFAVCQFLSAGAELWREVILQELTSILPLQGVYERSDVKSREKEGLPLRTGQLAGEPPPEWITIAENGCQFLVDMKTGHKTGFYLDQRENRAALKPFCQHAEVLNCFSYTGGFGLAALSGGAKQVTNIDTSQQAIDLLRKNVALNGFDETKVENIQGDIFKVLRQFRESGRLFDVIVLDPPKFAESTAQINRAARGYKDINMLAMLLLRPGGFLFTFSCSGHISPPLFQKIVADAALDAGRPAQIIRQLSQAADHPVLFSFPEGLYLKGLICRMI